MHETLDSTVGVGPGPNDVVGVHADPESVSANPALPAVPTATHATLELHDTEFKVAEVPFATLGGSGSGVKVHCDPDNDPIRGNASGLGDPTTYDPTAMHDVAETQETPLNCAPDQLLGHDKLFCVHVGVAESADEAVATPPTIPPMRDRPRHRRTTPRASFVRMIIILTGTPDDT